MKRTPRKMRKPDREELERLFTQLMRDLQAVRAPPCEWELPGKRWPLRVSLWSELPACKIRSPFGWRWSRSWPIGKALPIYVDLVSWLCGVLADPRPPKCEQDVTEFTLD